LSALQAMALLVESEHVRFVRTHKIQTWVYRELVKPSAMPMAKQPDSASTPNPREQKKKVDNPPVGKAHVHPEKNNILPMQSSKPFTKCQQRGFRTGPNHAICCMFLICVYTTKPHRQSQKSTTDQVLVWPLEQSSPCHGGDP